MEVESRLEGWLQEVGLMLAREYRLRCNANEVAWRVCLEQLGRVLAVRLDWRG